MSVVFLNSTGIVGKLNPKNKVDLTNPELTIIVEVIKAVCCISVVKDYTLYRKYNVQEVVKEDEPAKPVTDTPEEEKHDGGVKDKEETTEMEEENVSQNNEEPENGGK